MGHFFMALPEPLMTKALYPQWVSALGMCINTSPPPFLCKFLNNNLSF